MQGLAPLTFYCDVLIFASSAAYSHLQGFPFSTYGEELVILAQNVLLVAHSLAEPHAKLGDFGLIRDVDRAFSAGVTP